MDPVRREESATADKARGRFAEPVEGGSADFLLGQSLRHRCRHYNSVRSRLEEIDDRAALFRRIDREYLVRQRALRSLVEEPVDKSCSRAQPPRVSTEGAAAALAELSDAGH